MRLRAMCVVLGAVVLLGCPLRGAQADDDFVGRWDLSIGRGKSPSWLAVSRAGGELLGRFVAGGGGVHKVSSIEVSDGKLVFTRGKTRYEAALVAGKLQGKISQGGEPGPAFVGIRFEPKLDLTGTWKLVDSADYKYDLKLKHRGETLSGTCETARGVSAELYDVSLKDGKLGFSLTATKDGKQLAHRLEAEVSGDRIQGMARVEGRKNTKTFTGQRQRKWGKPTELFNGKDLDGWEVMGNLRNSHWVARDGVLDNPKGGANIKTKAKFKDFKLHVETKVPEHGNSGVYLRGRYEIQVADSHGKAPQAGGMGGFYSRITPTGNPSKPAGQWQSFDITLVGQYVTVVLNGQTIIDNQEVEGITGGAIDSNETEPGPIYLQGDHGSIAYRNIVLTPMEK